MESRARSKRLKYSPQGDSPSENVAAPKRSHRKEERATTRSKPEEPVESRQRSELKNASSTG